MVQKKGASNKPKPKITQSGQSETYGTKTNRKFGANIKFKCKTVRQKEYANLIKDKEIVISCGPAGVGKAQPLTSRILTPTGWTTMGDIKVGDNVIGDNGKPTEVLQIHPQGIIDIYGVTFSDGSYTECSDNHLWYTETYNDRNNRVRTENGRKYTFREGTVKELNEIKESLYTKRGDKNHTIPMVSPIEFIEQKLIVDPYLLGCLLGDGGLTADRITLTSADSEIIGEIEKLLPDELIISEVDSSKYGFIIKAKNKGIGNNTHLNELRDIEVMGKTSHNKSIPQKYIFNTINNRISLLQGLMDTDGYVNKNGTSSFFTSVSFELINGVKELVESLGGKCLLNTKTPTYVLNGHKKNGALAYTLTITLPPEINPFRLTRKYNRVKPKTKYYPKRYITHVELIGQKEAKCISVNNISNLYVTDDYIVTHNSYVAIATAIELLQEPDSTFEKILIVKPAVESEENLGFLPGDLKEKMAPYLASSIDIVDKIVGKNTRLFMETSELLMVEPLGFIRGKSIDNAILLVEEGQNMSPSQMKTLLTRIGANSKFVISGDLDQSDKYDRVEKSGLYDATRRHANIEEIGFLEFDITDIVRNPLISKILNNYKVENPKE